MDTELNLDEVTVSWHHPIGIILLLGHSFSRSCSTPSAQTFSQLKCNDRKWKESLDGQNWRARCNWMLFPLGLRKKYHDAHICICWFLNFRTIFWYFFLDLGYQESLRWLYRKLFTSIREIEQQQQLFISSYVTFFRFPFYFHSFFEYIQRDSHANKKVDNDFVVLNHDAHLCVHSLQKCMGYWLPAFYRLANHMRQSLHLIGWIRIS